ncbi:hypothetical protein Tco_1070408 [Tanacetum coccineum]|uniref:Uncharacterized protein n=1 Tax=Tanacetum coccineum TaxID=301880 RepID=A0ABQ5HMQ2_9ASTR
MGGTDVLKALLKPITHLGNWKVSFIFIENKIIPSDYPELLLDKNKLDKKSFKDKVLLHPKTDPLYGQIATYPCIVQTFPDPILYLAGLKTTWKHSPKRPVIYHRGQEMDFRSFMLEGVDGKLNFLHAKGVSEGQNSPFMKYLNNDAPMIDATPLSSVYPSNIVENVVDYDDPSYGEDEQTLVGACLPPHLEVSKKLKILGKRKVAFGVLGKALPLKAVLDNMLNSKTRELIYALQKAKASYDAIRARELDKDRSYAELERKCNEALQDLDKNPLVSDMRAKIKALQGQVDDLHSKYSRLILEEKNGLKQDRVAVFSKVIPDAAIKLVCSDDLEVAAMEEPFVLEKMLGYRPLLKEEYDQAGDALANASYPFLAEYVVNPYASLEQLL